MHANTVFLLGLGLLLVVGRGFGYLVPDEGAEVKRNEAEEGLGMSDDLNRLEPKEEDDLRQEDLPIRSSGPGRQKSSAGYIEDDNLRGENEMGTRSSDYDRFFKNVEDEDFIRSEDPYYPPYVPFRDYDEVMHTIDNIVIQESDSVSKHILDSLRHSTPQLYFRLLKNVIRNEVTIPRKGGAAASASASWRSENSVQRKGAAAAAAAAAAGKRFPLRIPEWYGLTGTGSAENSARNAAKSAAAAAAAAGGKRSPLRIPAWYRLTGTRSSAAAAASAGRRSAAASAGRRSAAAAAAAAGYRNFE